MCILSRVVSCCFFNYRLHLANWSSYGMRFHMWLDNPRNSDWNLRGMVRRCAADLRRFIDGEIGISNSQKTKLITSMLNTPIGRNWFYLMFVLQILYLVIDGPACVYVFDCLVLDCLPLVLVGLACGCSFDCSVFWFSFVLPLFASHYRSSYALHS